MKKRAFFLDRDGVVIRQKAYLADPDQVELEPSALPALRRLHAAGFLAVLITNQSGVARGKFTAHDVELVHERLAALLAAGGEKLDGCYTCMHHPDYSGDCDCRKPKPGLILQAARELDVDVARSVMVGDKPSDVECGVNAGCGDSLLVLTGYGEESAAQRPDLPAARDLDDAVTVILAKERR